MVETVLVKGENGAIWTMALPLSEPIAERLAKGYLQIVDPAGAPTGESPSKPAPYASKTAWVGYAASQGMKPDDAEALTKHDLIERYGVP